LSVQKWGCKYEGNRRGNRGKKKKWEWTSKVLAKKMQGIISYIEEKEGILTRPGKNRGKGWGGAY